MKELFDVVHEDDGLLVINKPPGLACHPTKGDAWSSLISRVRLYLGEGVQPHMINRLDRETSGIVLVAKELELARELRRLWEARRVIKSYLAVVHGDVVEASGVVDAPLGPDEGSEVAIKDCVRAGGAPARTEFQRIRSFRTSEGAFSLLRVQPHTGRKHQIRIHLAYCGYPIVGDKLYGVVPGAYLAFVRGELTPKQQAALIVANQMLHAELVTYSRRGHEWRFRAPAPPTFTRFIPAGRGEEGGELTDSFRVS